MSKLFADLMDRSLNPVPQRTSEPPPSKSPTQAPDPQSEPQSPTPNDQDFASSIAEPGESTFGDQSSNVSSDVTPQEPAVTAQSKPRRSEKTRTNQPILGATNQASNIAILQLSKADIDELRTTAYKNQTFRFSEDELNWLRDRSYGLTRALNRKVGQNDLLRLSLKVFRKLVADKQEVLEEILDPII